MSYPGPMRIEERRTRDLASPTPPTALDAFSSEAEALDLPLVTVPAGPLVSRPGQPRAPAELEPQPVAPSASRPVANRSPTSGRIVLLLLVVAAAGAIGIGIWTYREWLLDVLVVRPSPAAVSPVMTTPPPDLTYERQTLPVLAPPPVANEVVVTAVGVVASARASQAVPASRRAAPPSPRPAPRAEIVAAPPPRASLFINAVPWADVWVGGVHVGQTPIGDLTLPIGVHDVEFRHPQLGDRRLRVTLGASGARAAIDMGGR